VITYEYECWKCSEWHKSSADNAGDFLTTLTYLNTAVRLLNYEKPRPMINWKQKLFLFPLPKQRGLLIGASQSVNVYSWRTARWEYADHGGGSDDWNAEVIYYGR